MSTPAWTRQTPPLAEIEMTTLNSPIMAFTMPGSREEHDLNAPYQRGSVWDVERQRNLIRSLLLHVPVGAIIRAKKTRNDPTAGYYRIVDGKQRIEAILAFIDDELEVPADWFPDRALNSDHVDEQGMVRYSGLTEYGRRSFEGTPIAVIELTSDIETVEVETGTGTNGSNLQYRRSYRSAAEALAYEAFVYGLINTGGVEQTPEDLANAARIAQA